MQNDLQEKLKNYVSNMEDPNVNFELGLEYEKLNQYASAAGYYIRVAEFGNEDSDIVYESIIHLAKCFDKQGDREHSHLSTLRRAMILNPRRPEAYYHLCRFYNWNMRYDEAYHLSDLALKLCKFDLPILKNTDYINPYNYQISLTFEKALSGWWWGKYDECRSLLDYLKEFHWESLSDYERSQWNTYDAKFKLHPVFHESKLYDGKNQEKLRYKFKKSHKVSRNYSQMFQDIFVLSILDGKTNGFYVEIGSGNPFYANNTALLEKTFGWKGVGIDNDARLVELYNQNRVNKSINADATDIDFKKELNNYNIENNIIDYLQFDLDPAPQTYASLLRFPFDHYKCRVITYEHDYYCDEHRKFRDLSRQIFESHGYRLIAGNISPDGQSSCEDWWAHPDLVNADIVSTMISENNTNIVLDAQTYILGPEIEPVIEKFKTKEILTKIKEVKPLEVNEKVSSNQSETEKFSKFEINSNYDQKKKVWVIDNFYKDPYAVREFALQQEFHEGGWGRGFIGRRTNTQFLFPGLKERFEEIMGKKITAWEDYSENGKFQNCVAGEPITYHCDAQQWGGLLYLSPEAPYQCGTSLYAHKKNRARTFLDPGYGDDWAPKGEEIYYGGIHCDATPWEPVDVMGNVFNRLIIFDASSVHAASEYFGYNLESGRLWQMFFFDAE